MKINEIFEAPQTPVQQWRPGQPLPQEVMKNHIKKVFPRGGLMNISNTDAAGIKYMGQGINQVFLPLYIANPQEAFQNNKGMYMAYSKDEYQLINTDEPEGKKVASAIVKAVLAEPKDKPGIFTKMKDKFDKLTDPDDPTSAGYNTLQRKGAARGPLATMATKLASRIGQGK